MEDLRPVSSCLFPGSDCYASVLVLFYKMGCKFKFKTIVLSNLQTLNFPLSSCRLTSRWMLIKSNMRDHSAAASHHQVQSLYHDCKIVLHATDLWHKKVHLYVHTGRSLAFAEQPPAAWLQKIIKSAFFKNEEKRIQVAQKDRATCKFCHLQDY